MALTSTLDEVGPVPVSQQKRDFQQGSTKPEAAQVRTNRAATNVEAGRPAGVVQGSRPEVMVAPMGMVGGWGGEPPSAETWVRVYT